MPEYADAHHRPHAIHTGETPSTPITRGPESLVVTLDGWPNENRDLFPSLYDALVSNWGESPSRAVNQPCPDQNIRDPRFCTGDWWEHDYGWCKLNDEQKAYIEACFAGQTLQQALERFTFSFCVDGCTRAETHQIVRTRVGAGFMQHGGRDNDWRHRAWTMPETIARACDLYSGSDAADGHVRSGKYMRADGALRESCIADWAPLDRFVDRSDKSSDLRESILAYLAKGKELYSALVDAGIPWQDARRVLWMGTQTYIHCDYNYVALKGVLGNRLEHVMDWEVNCVAQLMQREVLMKCPPIFGKHLGSHSDRARKALFAGLESWPPDGKWPTTPEQDALPRMHRGVQMPFFVLHPDSMTGGPVKWIPTNGSYADARKAMGV